MSTMQSLSVSAAALSVWTQLSSVCRSLCWRYQGVSELQIAALLHMQAARCGQEPAAFSVVIFWLCSAGVFSQDRLLAVRDSVSGALDYLRDGLNRRQDVASVRALLEVTQDAAHVMANVALTAGDGTAEPPTHICRQSCTGLHISSCV